MALPALWLWNAAEDRQAAAHCIDCCVTVHYALAEYGIASEIQAVGVGIAAPGIAPQLYGGLGTKPISIDRTDHFVLYVPLPVPCRNACHNPAIAQRADEYREAGVNLAANVFDIMRGEGFLDRTAQSPYPRLTTLLTALDGMTTVANMGGYTFSDPATGRELRLADIR